MKLKLFPRFWILILFTLFAVSAIGQDQGRIKVDADFPGGNIVVDKLENNDIYLHQDLRDTKGDWFYWYFRVRGAENETLNIHFTKSNVIGVRGPAVSLDQGKTWSWAGKDCVSGKSFTYKVPDQAKEIRFCFAMAYLESHLYRFLSGYQNHPHLKKDILCQSKHGRKIEKLHLGKIGGNCNHRVLITCRHHACEMMANYALEGIMESILANDEHGKWFCDNVEFLIIPFMDKDGVQKGDQGKNRIPHDHNRDYSGNSIYLSVKTLRKLVPKWSDEKLRFALDMHCPYIRGPNNENIYFVGTPNQTIWKKVLRFSEILSEIQEGPLVYKPENNIPFGSAWNTANNYKSGKSCSRWSSELPGIKFASTIEIPYANANEHAVTAESARTLGHDLAKAIRIFLEKEFHSH